MFSLLLSKNDIDFSAKNSTMESYFEFRMQKPTPEILQTVRAEAMDEKYLIQVFQALQSASSDLSAIDPKEGVAKPENILMGMRVLLSEVKNGSKSAVIQFLEVERRRDSSKAGDIIPNPDELCFCGLSIRQAATRVFCNSLDADTFSEWEAPYFKEGEFELELFFSAEQIDSLTPVAKDHICNMSYKRMAQSFQQFLAILSQIPADRLRKLDDNLQEFLNIRQYKALESLSNQQFDLLIEIDRFDYETMEVITDISDEEIKEFSTEDLIASYLS